MTTEPIGAELIERYLRTRRPQYFRGQHDGEYFFILAVERLHVHLETAGVDPDMFTIRITPAYFFPAAQRVRLTRFADRWNRNNQWAKAIVHASSDPNRIGVVAEYSYRIAQRRGFDDFASFVDHSVASAIELFGEITPVIEVPSGRTAWLRDAG
jgi:hypothetical protein